MDQWRKMIPKRMNYQATRQFFESSDESFIDCLVKVSFSVNIGTVFGCQDGFPEAYSLMLTFPS
jgi:hypothetical protein